MAQNYTFNGSLTLTANSATGYSQSMSGSTTINITGVDQIASGRIDCATGSDATIMAAPGHGRILYVRNMDDTSTLEVYEGASSDNDVIGVLKPGEFLFTIIRGTGTTTARGTSNTVTAEYFAVEIDSAA
jgi:hypothetical protein|tara:strand:+ start:450 stop:839 length:390 start_codon:yes stop_codon:yes gene_type:complete